MYHYACEKIYLAQEEFVRMFREESGRPIVELAHMEIAEPSIEVAFKRCVEQGATLVAVSPFFLSPGRHWQEVSLCVRMNSYSWPVIISSQLEYLSSIISCLDALSHSESLLSLNRTFPR